MHPATFAYLQQRWEAVLPDVPWPFDLAADPNAVVTSMGRHLEARTKRPPTVLTHNPEPYLALPKPKALQSTNKTPTKSEP